MAETMTAQTDSLMAEYPDISHIEPDISHIETEDDTPVDNVFSEKQQRLLARSLNCSWNPGRPFIAASDVGIFFAINRPPVVPDMFLSLDVKYAEDIWEKKHRSYFLWEFGKPPEVAVEIVSNKKGGESTTKIGKYAQAGVWYYIIFDPQRLIQNDVLRMYELHAGQYIPIVGNQLPRIDLGVTLWEGCFEEVQTQWLRWCDHKGKLIETGEERAEKEQQRAENAEQKNLDAARKMLADGLDPDMVMKYTSLSVEEIACLSGKENQSDMI